jgi:predicted NACHT family NTPase
LSSQQFLGQEQLLPDGLLDGFDEVEMQNIMAGLVANQSP